MYKKIYHQNGPYAKYIKHILSILNVTNQFKNDFETNLYPRVLQKKSLPAKLHRKLNSILF